MRGGREPGHVAAGLGDDHLRDLRPRRRGWSAAARSGAPTARHAAAIDLVELGQRLLDQVQPVAGSTGPAGRGGRRSGPSSAWARSGILRRILPLAISASTRGVGLAVDHRGQHRPRRDRVQRRGHRRQLDRGVLQHQLQPHRLPGPVTHQLHPVPGQHPQPPDLRRRHERRRQQPVLQQLRDPLRVPHVGLAARHRLHVRGVEQPDLHHLLQAVERRLPIRRGRLHRRDRHPVLDQPVPHHPQRPGRRLERPRLAVPATAARPASARTPSPTPSRHPGRRPARTSLPSRSAPSRCDGRRRRRPVSPGGSSARTQTHVLAATIQRHPKTPRHTPLRAHPHQCVPTSPRRPPDSHPPAQRSKIASRHTSCTREGRQFVRTRMGLTPAPWTRDPPGEAVSVTGDEMVVWSRSARRRTECVEPRPFVRTLPGFLDMSLSPRNDLQGTVRSGTCPRCGIGDPTDRPGPASDMVFASVSTRGLRGTSRSGARSNRYPDRGEAVGGRPRPLGLRQSRRRITRRHATTLREAHGAERRREDEDRSQVGGHVGRPRQIGTRSPRRPVARSIGVPALSVVAPEPRDWSSRRYAAVVAASVCSRRSWCPRSRPHGCPHHLETPRRAVSGFHAHATRRTSRHHLRHCFGSTPAAIGGS